MQMRFVRGGLFSFCLFLIFALSSCSTASFLQRRYTPGEYVDHVSGITRTCASLSEKSPAHKVSPITRGSDQAGGAREQADSKKGPAAATKPSVLASLKNTDRQSIVPADISRMKQNLFSKRRALPEQKGMQAVPGRKGFVLPAEESSGAEHDARIGFNCGLASFIIVLLLIAVNVLFYIFAIGTAAILLEGAALFLIASSGYLVLWLLAVIFGIKAISEAKRHGEGIPQKAINGIVLAFLPFLFIMLFILVHKSL